MTAPTTLRALAAACDDCARFDRIIRSRSECASEQRNAMMCALPPGGWPDTATALRTMADTVEALGCKLPIVIDEVESVKGLPWPALTGAVWLRTADGALSVEVAGVA